MFHLEAPKHITERGIVLVIKLVTTGLSSMALLTLMNVVVIQINLFTVARNMQKKIQKLIMMNSKY
jgi:hypothetical protein